MTADILTVAHNPERFLQQKQSIAKTELQP